MTIDKKFKKRVRERMQRTGESYSAAKRSLEGSLGSRSPSPAPAVGSEPSHMETYKENRRRFRESSLSAWCHLVEKLAGLRADVSWSNMDDIIRILEMIAAEAPLNYTLHPDGGGRDLTGAAESHEPGCIELEFPSTTVIVSPITLDLVKVAGDPLAEWAYFRLETGVLPPSGVYEDLGDQGYEQLLELRPDEYTDCGKLDSGFFGHDEEGNELPLPPDARVITRYFRGAFLVVAKGSTYNSIPATSDGRHAQMTAKEFRAYIEEAVQGLRDAGEYGRDPREG